jgi:phospholipid/cholesterol/gamma-HCH transport system permease protein
MPPPSLDVAAISQDAEHTLHLSGRWTALFLGNLETQVQSLSASPSQPVVAVKIDASKLQALDTTGAWLLQKLMHRAGMPIEPTSLQGLPADVAHLFSALVGSRDPTQAAAAAAAAAPAVGLPSHLESLGRWVMNVLEQVLAMLAFVGETALSVGRCFMHPRSIRWRAVAFNIRSAGVNALPIVGLLAFLLGVVVAYQSADQLRQYGANIFVADLIGISMLREFAPLITAIIIAGRSGSAYAAQIGTMAVTEEIDAMRTLGLSPQEMLVLPKLLAMLIVMPLLTVFADVLGVFGGMVLARAQLGVGFPEFIDRLVKAIVMSTYLVGIAKAPVFGAIIVVVGCFQGFRTKGGADSVGRQTTRSVVQSIFLVIVADAVFSVIFSALNL